MSRLAGAFHDRKTIVEVDRVYPDRDGRFVGLESRIVADAGAFPEGSAESLGGVLIAGPYAWPALDVRAYGVNNSRRTA